ncbi:hypothetical protein HG536_0A03920 [Torulaspora globosa]|uniref:ATPase synthesis protein 25 n=1 Tax=Torulaspora globosa TaxID=48254 RepID=A0A7G3ZAN8_9SACH|nr:uncharacterized protein HG536_0A03920 [Torulaspora globosa]QLL30574.1 hypothetical protein HG536_0A03920 [Torulaspora globosa]
MLRLSRGRLCGLNQLLPCYLSGSRQLRYYSTKDEKASDSTEDDGISSPQPSKAAQPWYVTMIDRNETVRDSVFQAQKVEFPNGSPESLRKITNRLKDHLGVTDILVFDLRDADRGNYTTAVAKVSDFMVIGTAKSAKHCQRCFMELNGFIKREYGSVAYVEGDVNGRDEKRRHKRLARKTNLSKNWGSNSSALSGGFQSNSEAWFMIDCHVDNIFLNILTEQRREELSLEELYAPENERYKYKRSEEKVPQEETLELQDDNNILAGLKRLAYQRRQYSTVPVATAISGKLSGFLEAQDFNNASSFIDEHKHEHSLTLLQTIAKSFATHKVPVVDTTKLREWHTLFDQCWPLVLDAETASLHWSTRLRFLKMLNVANRNFYPVRMFINDYLLLKRSTGFPLVRDDLLQFLQMVTINLSLNPKADYWDLVKANGDVVQALKLFDELNGDSLLHDELVMTLLLRTMVLNDDKRTRLHSLYELVDYVMHKRAVSPAIMASVLEILGGIRDWNKFFQFWELGADDFLPGEDDRPWYEFLRIVVNSNDLNLMNKLVNEGHLLWLKRNEVELTQDIESQLNKLFIKVDPQGVTLQSLKNYLY